jgi:hypothetical protein
MPVSGSPKPAIILRCPQCRQPVVLEDRRKLDLADSASCGACGREGKVVEFVHSQARKLDQHGATRGRR